MTARLAVLSLCALVAFGVTPARSDEIPESVQRAIDKGLDWLDRTQNRDGHFDANGGQYPTTMTALGGMAFLMEGSTLRQGRYSPTA